MPPNPPPPGPVARAGAALWLGTKIFLPRWKKEGGRRAGEAAKGWGCSETKAELPELRARLRREIRRTRRLDPEPKPRVPRAAVKVDLARAALPHRQLPFPPGQPQHGEFLRPEGGARWAGKV